MNGKKAKELRRQTRERCAAAGIQSDTTYKVISNDVRFQGRTFPWLNPTISTARAEKLDAQHDIARARKYGVLVNLLLQDLFGEPRMVAPQIILGSCERGVYQRVKRALYG